MAFPRSFATASRLALAGALAASSCGDEDVAQTSISGGGSGTGLSMGLSASDSGNPDATAGDTSVMSGGADDGTGSGDGGADGNGGTGGVRGDICQEAQSGLCEEPGQTVHCYSGAPDTCNVGQCEGGMQTCTVFDLDLGEWTACEGEVLPELEVCDGVDNDCDGDTDEDLGDTTCGLGACEHTVANCVGGEESTCDAFEGASDEVCDGVDNDCDGDIDEDFDGIETDCGVGECQHSVAACLDGMMPTCDPFAGAIPEVCDGLDNDCDGMIDNGLGTDTCGLGECLHTVDLCVMGVPNVCDPFEGQSAEICDGLDNDCDGSTDEGFGPVTCGLGVCEHLVEQCVMGMPEMCDPFAGAGPEICEDGLDNDCDGVVDNGCVCGNGILQGSEQCDAPDLGGQTCVTLGHDGGTLACTGACTFDESGCYDCGDGVADAGEQCDGGDLDGGTCVTLGFDGGALGCDAACNYDTSGCYGCGDGSIDPGESCDGANLGGQTCVGLGFDGGVLGCSAGCAFDTSGCYTCGDGAIDPGELCDGMNLGGQTCVSLGFDGGTLVCDAACGFDTSGCYTCGDGSLDPGESCDGANLGGQTCVTQGFDGGTLGCDAACGFDTSGCYTCGDGSIDPGESCDGANLNGQTCVTQGFDGGTLACDAACGFDTSGCFGCGDGSIDPGEQCDGANLGGQTCLGLGFGGGVLTCDASCNYDTSGCGNCGNGVIDPGEQCDGIDFGGMDCEDYGSPYGNLQCDAMCQVDTSNCTDMCGAPAAHLVCDTPGGDPLQAIGLNCPGDATNSTPISNVSFVSPDANAYRVAGEYGNSGTWLPREGNALLVLTTGVLPALNLFDQVVLGYLDTQNGSPNGNPGASGPPGPDNPVGLPAPITAVDGSNFGLGGTPFVNCDLVNDCSDSLDTQWINGGGGAYDLLYFQFDVDVPIGTSGYTFDISWFDAEYPEWVGSQFTDIFVVWSESEAYTGNIMVNFGESFSSNTAAPFVTHSGNDPEMAGTGFQGEVCDAFGNCEPVGGSTGWYTVTAPVVPSEAITLTWALFETGDHYFDGTVLVDNFAWDCDGCIMGADCLMVPAAP